MFLAREFENLFVLPTLTAFLYLPTDCRLCWYRCSRAQAKCQKKILCWRCCCCKIIRYSKLGCCLQLIRHQKYLSYRQSSRLSRGRGGQKLPILLSKKTTKKKGGGQKQLILRRHSLWTAPKRDFLKNQSQSTDLFHQTCAQGEQQR